MFSNSPKLFAANHVLHRLLPPRHSPSALISLTINLTVFHYTACSARTLRAPWCTEPDTLDSKKVFNYQRPPARRAVLGTFQRPACIGLAAREGHFFESRAVLTCDSKFIFAMRLGGADRDRTDDLRLAKPALSQLSYSPEKEWWAWVDSNHRPPAYQADALTN